MQLDCHRNILLNKKEPENIFNNLNNKEEAKEIKIEEGRDLLWVKNQLGISQTR